MENCATHCMISCSSFTRLRRAPVAHYNLASRARIPLTSSPAACGFSLAVERAVSTWTFPQPVLLPQPLLLCVSLPRAFLVYHCLAPFFSLLPQIALYNKMVEEGREADARKAYAAARTANEGAVSDALISKASGV